MVELLHGVVLGAIQGITEFFPVSSSGHLILVPALLGWPDQGLAFDTVLHLGTLTALFWCFRSDLLDLWKRGVRQNDKHAQRFILQVGVAAIPALVAGAIFGDVVEQLRSPLPVAASLVVWGIALFVADRFASSRRNAVTETKQISWRQAIIVGLSQCIALLPGTSRSGITMTGGLFSGLDRSTSVTFSFFVSIPTIAAAGGYGLLKLLHAGIPDGGTIPLISGFIAAIVFGTWAIQFLRSYVAKHSLDVFVWYRFALAVIVLLIVR